MEEKLKKNKNKINKIIFSKFIKKNFDFFICEIKRKYTHSLKVANICLKLSKQLGLDESLSYTIGLLHDYARFTQYTEHKTFSDLKTFDHGLMACKLLFDENQIANFCVEKKFYPVIYISIFMHNKKNVDKQSVKKYLEQHPCLLSLEETLKYIHLIRDADKIDLLRVITTKNFNIENTLDGISSSIKKEVENFKTPSKKNSKTKLDAMVIHLSFLYNLHFTQSQSFIKLTKFLKAYKAKYLKILNPKDKEFLLQHIHDISAFLSKKQLFLSKK